MNRLPLVSPETATGKAADLLAAVKSKLGLVPNMTKAMANSPAVLDGYLSFSGALGHGTLSAKVREQIAILAAEVNDCGYCLSAHTAIGKMVGLAPDELSGARTGRSGDAKTAGALKFADAVLRTKGAVTDEQVRAARAAGLSDGELAEVVANVALNLFTNYFNRAADTAIDFPVVQPLKA